MKIGNSILFNRIIDSVEISFNNKERHKNIQNYEIFYNYKSFYRPITKYLQVLINK